MRSMVRANYFRRSLPRTELVLGFAAACLCLLLYGRADQRANEAARQDNISATMNGIAERYVKLVLAVGEHDPLYVDAYFGPLEWRKEAGSAQKPLATIEAEAAALLAELRKTEMTSTQENAQLRRAFLIKQLESLLVRTRMLSGSRYTFDEEAKGLYDVVVPSFDESDIKAKLARIDALLPARQGSRADRLERLRKDFIIPKDKVVAVFGAAIEEARQRTRRHITLPENESFSLECVTNKSWGAYNWYKGNYQSVIQLNTDLPIFIDAALDLACHEGYPGHHVQSVLFEHRLVKELGWVEFTISPLFSPLSPMQEGSADFGVEVAFPGGERVAFEREVLYPLAGLDLARAASYNEIMTLVRGLGPSRNEAARRYLNRQMTAEDAVRFQSAYVLMTLERARKAVSFMDQYRSYVINYNVGYNLVKNFVEGRGGTADHPDKRWEEYAALISAPHPPSALK
jgi:hypothetical protein